MSPSAVLGLLVLGAAPASAADPRSDPPTSSFDEVWSLVKLYDNPNNPVVQKLALTGRLQFDYTLVNGDGSPAAGRDEDIAADFGELRRMRSGFRATLFNDFTALLEADFDPNEDPSYRRLADAYLGWQPSQALALKLGKQIMGFTLDGATSSRELLTTERNNLSNNLWFTNGNIPGLSVAGAHGNWFYKTGVFSQGEDDGEFGNFNAGTSWLASIGYDLSKPLAADSADIRLDYVHNDRTPPDGLFTNRSLQQIVSLNFRYEHGTFGLRGDLAAGDGYGRQPDLWGFVAMPYYNFTTKLQGVLRYTYINSAGNDGVRFARYEARALNQRRGDQYQEAYAGLNYFLYGHKLKLQTGVQFATMRDRADNGGEFDGWSWTTGLRISW